MSYIIRDTNTGEIIGSVVTNHSMDFDETMRLAGFDWLTLENDGVECDGWYDKNGILWDESSAEIEAI